ncbi:hypothetical protein LTR62_007524 [Meristemomyces frigidus]|uniref:Uncharacterized protein n=1 Tax=Meristemomyces frigidus TaxID=1508187 RepID=A0AAN7YDI7_9PEZI|nr:hypothetical protein LTR62_007524 [Meristemomyces frigidus]
MPSKTLTNPDGAASTPGAERNDTKDIHVQLMYLEDDPLYKTVKPVQITPNFADRAQRTNVRLASGPKETLRDVRGLHGKPLGNFSLDDNGFAYIKAPTAFRNWSSQPQIAQEYLPELEAVLRREVEGCDEILFYDARIRQEADEGLRVEGLSYNPFARQVHSDNTERSVIEKIRSLTEMKADYLLNGRARIINLWRPIKHPVYDCGLAIADGGTLRNDDIIECDRHRADTGDYWDTMGVVQYRPGFDWYYCSEQDEEDVILFKNYDSATHVNARICLHTAFDVPAETVPSGALTRESIEVRALVFTYPASGHRPAGSLPHPLALSLEHNDLRKLTDEHTITDRLRTDIDEANEVKDAVLLLRRQEIKKLERLNRAVIAELNRANASLETLRLELAHLQQQNVAQSNIISDLHYQRDHDLDRNADQPQHSLQNSCERAVVLQQTEGQERETRQWKGDDLSHGVEAPK